MNKDFVRLCTNMNVFSLKNRSTFVGSTSPSDSPVLSSSHQALLGLSAHPTVSNHPQDIHAMRHSRVGSYLSVPPDQRKIGEHYFPPNTCNLQVLVPFRSKPKTNQLLATAGFSSTTVHPDTMPDFNWRDADLVAKYRFDGVTPKVKILDPQNQYSCGSCWAVSSASVLTDRYTLFEGKQTPNLSATYLLSCDKVGKIRDTAGDLLDYTNNQCMGGMPAAAGVFMEQTGITTNDCDPYDGWCKDSCKSGGLSESSLSGTVPQCTPGKCDNCSASNCNAKVYKARAKSTEALATIEDMKSEIFLHGPIVGAYMVFEDMQMRAQGLSNQPGWENTANIYMQIQDVTDSTGGLYLPYKATNQVGGHAIVIVGWGTEKDQAKLNQLDKNIPKELANHWKSNGIPYWLIRNSWGTEWNGDGYFKCAMSDPNFGVNMQLLLDRPKQITVGGMGKSGIAYFGGGTAFFPDTKATTIAIPNQEQQTQKVTPSGCPTPVCDVKQCPDSDKNAVIALATTLGVLIAAILVYVIFYYGKRGNQKRKLL